MELNEVLGGLVILLLVLIGIGPLVFPIRPYKASITLEELQDADSQFTTVDGVLVHYKERGKQMPVMVLLHGYGASVFSWQKVIDRLGRIGTVIAYDRPGFGLSGRPNPPIWNGRSLYCEESQAEVLVKFLDVLGIDQAILIGNFAGGTIAAFTALEAPDRVSGLVLVDSAVFRQGGVPEIFKPLMKLRHIRWLGLISLRLLQKMGVAAFQPVHSRLPDAMSEVMEGYSKPFMTDNWDQAFWDHMIAHHQVDLAGRFDEFSIPILVVTGDRDWIVPTQASIKAANKIPGASLAVLKNCGHLPQETCSEEFFEIIREFIVSNNLN